MYNLGNCKNYKNFGGEKMKTMNPTMQQANGISPQRIVRRLIDDWNVYEDKHGRVPMRLSLRKQDVLEIMDCHSVLCTRIAALLFQSKDDRKLGRMEVVFFAKTYGFE